MATSIFFKYLVEIFDFVKLNFDKNFKNTKIILGEWCYCDVETVCMTLFVLKKKML